MRLLKRPKRKVKGFGRKIDANFCSVGAIDTMLRQFQDEDKEYVLEVGYNGKKEDCYTVDFGGKADYNGDIRGCFTSDFSASEDLLKIKMEHYRLIKVIHTIEHIQWIYRQSMFEWFRSLLGSGGVLYVDTPNLEVIAKVYVENLNRVKEGLPPSYPFHEHPDMHRDGTPTDLEGNMQWWVNFKLYSGCSPGDYHHACYDAYSLGRTLSEAGFERIQLYSGASLHAIAHNPGEMMDITADAIVLKLTGGGVGD